MKVKGKSLWWNFNMQVLLRPDIPTKKNIASEAALVSLSQFGLNVICVGSANTEYVGCVQASVTTLLKSRNSLQSYASIVRALSSVRDIDHLFTLWGPFLSYSAGVTAEFVVIRRRITKRYHKHKKKYIKKWTCLECCKTNLLTTQLEGKETQLLIFNDFTTFCFLYFMSFVNHNNDKRIFF